MMDLHNEDQEKRLENKNLLVRSAGCANVQAYDMAILDMDGCIPTSIDDYPPNPVYAVAKVCIHKILLIYLEWKVLLSPIFLESPYHWVIRNVVSS